MKSGNNSESLELKTCLKFWGRPGRISGMSLGLSVKDATLRAHELRQQLKKDTPTYPRLGSADEHADVLHATCRALEDDMESAPLEVLNDAGAIYQSLSGPSLLLGELQEREALQCSLAFLCWRGARLLNLSKEAQRWEARYLQTFRASLHWDLLEMKLGLEGEASCSSKVFENFSSEEVFQAVALLQERQDGSLDVALNMARSLYEWVSINRSRFPRDLRFFFLGASARAFANLYRAQGRHREAKHWLDVAESHFRLGVDPTPQLARVTYLRLAVAYTEGRLEVVARELPALDRYLSDVEMEEDRIKCAILGAASLKVAGRFEEALEILEPLRISSGRIRAVWQGWVLLQLGDIHQICGDYQRGFEELEQAARILKAAKHFCGLADVNIMIATGLRAQGRVAEAVALFRSSQRDYAHLGMRAAEAYTRLLVAEAYLGAGDAARAEAEVRSVLPILEEHEMVCEAVAAVNLLREVLRRKQLDPQRLRQACKLLRPK